MIPLDDLISLLAQTIKHVKRIHPADVDLSEIDYYWQLGNEQFDMSIEPPTAIEVGSLSDDVLNLKLALAEPNRASALDLNRIAAVLRALSEKLVPESPDSR